ncbi:MAG TPA: hypothetical protein VFB73_09965 [Chloroflexota bacterium]|nr:hypothetical protein [Chloroflexota bacterium]
MDQKHVSALLWLYDGTILTLDEFRHYVQRENTAEMYTPYSPYELRKIILHELRNVIQQTFDMTGKQSAQVEVFSAEINGVIAAERALLDLDTLPGHRMTLTALPSQLTYPPEWYSGNPTIYPPSLQSSALREQWRQISEQRYYAYLQNLMRYGGRSIYYKTSIEHYLTAVQHPRSLGDRIAHIRYWIRLIETHDAYEVGLTSSRPDLGLAIKSTKMAMLRAVHPYGSTQVNTWPNFGPRCILWMDDTSVLQFLLDFETAWDAIPAVDRNKDSVVAWLSELIQRIDR